MTGLDHMMSVIPALEAGAAAAKRLGFTITERGVHPGRGTANHLIMLPGRYWELMAIETPTPHNELILRTLARPGLLGCALQAADIETERDLALRRGVPVDAPVELSRPVEAGAASRVARFRTARTPPDGRFEGFFFYCQHLTPDLVWREELMDHPNGATSLIGIDVVATDVRTVATLLAQMIGAPSSDQAGDGVSLRVGGLEFWVTTPATYAERYAGAPPAPAHGHLGAFAGLRFRVPRLAHAEALIAAGEITTEKTGEGLTAWDDALGQTLFHFLED